MAAPASAAERKERAEHSARRLEDVAAQRARAKETDSDGPPEPPPLLAWYPTPPADEGLSKDGYVWSVCCSDRPVVAPAGWRDVPGACELDAERSSIGHAVWSGTGVRPADHPGAHVTFYDGQDFPQTCGVCGDTEATHVIFGRVLEWKSSYSLGNYEWLQEYELVHAGCAGPGADRFTARYKKLSANMDPRGSTFFAVDVELNIGTKGGDIERKRVAPTRRRAPGESCANHKCLHDGCKRNTIRSTPFCKLHENDELPEERLPPPQEQQQQQQQCSTAARPTLKAAAAQAALESID